MNDPNNRKSLFTSSCEIGDRDGFNVLRRKSVQIKRVGDLDIKGLGKWIVELFVDGG
ncbi:MAG: hypothetical protein ABI481_12105 [Pyrinomonadaceae bacterium]